MSIALTRILQVFYLPMYILYMIHAVISIPHFITFCLWEGINHMQLRANNGGNIDPIMDTGILLMIESHLCTVVTP